MPQSASWSTRVFRGAWSAAESALIALRPCPLERGEGFCPLFIVGSGRSGLTLLRRLVTAGGEIGIPPELQGTAPFLMEVERSPRRSWRFICSEAWYQLSTRDEWWDFGLSRNDVLERLHAIPRSDRSAAAVLDAVHRLYAERHGSEERWGDKTARHAEFLPLIDRTFPDACYLHALRDGVDVVHSLLRTGMERSARSAGELWVRRVTAVGDFADAHPDRVTEVRYEELVADPGAYMAGVCGFAGLRWDPSWADRLDHLKGMKDVLERSRHNAVRQPITARSVGCGREGLDAATRQELAFMNETLERFGYEPV